MEHRAEYSPGYFRRFLWIAIACGAFAAWCFYDGLIAYPKKYKQAEAYWALDEAKRDVEWSEITKEKGWNPAKPDPLHEISASISKQFMMAGICFLIGIPCILKWWLAKGSWVESTKTGLRNSSGKQLEFQQIESIDKFKWSDKGIAKIRYHDGNRKRTFVLDDFKFERATMGKIMRVVESQVPPEMIVNGPPEPSEDEDAEEDAVSDASAETVKES